MDEQLVSLYHTFSGSVVAKIVQEAGALLMNKVKR
jgi:hypothetical protein